MSKAALLKKCESLGIKSQKHFTKEKLTSLIQEREKTFSIVLSANGSVRYVYHIADIHIRVLERHLEYRQVFNTLYEYLKSQDHLENSIIVICGDIFHNKDRFISETILLFDDFIKNLTSITDTFVIIGNHDCFHHTDRLDSLSGIVTISNYSNFHLLKESGVYKFKNIQFGVSSLTDKIIIKSDKLEESGVKIALYHGCVGSAEEGGITLKGLDISTFDGYDLCLLGDIHKRQYLNKNKTIAYPGSLIQQNHKEDLIHGLLKWDLADYSSEFIPIHNDYSFITIEMNDVLDLSKISFTKYSRIRLLLNYGDIDTDIDLITKELEKYTEVISVKKVLQNKDKSALELDENENECTLPEKERHLIRSLLGDKPETFIEKVLNLHDKYTKDNKISFEKDDSVPWTIEKIEFRNIFSYGGDHLNVITFHQGITGILGENAIGKSSILNTILYGIFGSVYKTQNYSNKNIISKFSNKESLLVRIFIDFGNSGTKFVIERTAKNKKRSTGIGMEETVRFYKAQDDGIIELNLSTKPETEAFIKTKLSISNKEEFILTNLYSNVSYGGSGGNSVLSMTNAQLEDTFAALFDLEKYKILYKNAKQDYKTLLDDINCDINRINFLEDSILHLDIVKLEKDLKIFSKQLLNLREDKSELEKILGDIEEKVIKLSTKPKDLNKGFIEDTIQENTKILEEYKGDIKELIKSENEIENELTRLKKIFKAQDMEKFLQFERVEMNIVADSIQELETQIAILEEKREKIPSIPEFSNEYLKAKKALASIEKNSTINLGKILQTIQELKLQGDHFLLPVNTRNEIVNDLSSKSYIDPKELLKYEKIVNDKENHDKKIQENIINEEKISKLKRALKLKKTAIAYNTKDNIKRCIQELEYIDIHYEIIDLRKDLEYIENNQQMNLLLEEKSEIIKQIKEVISQTEETVITLNAIEKDISFFNKIEDQIINIESLLNPKKINLELLKNYVNVIHDKKLPKAIIKQVIHQVANEANKVIFNMTGMMCYIEEVNEKWEISIKKNKLFLGPEHCSGYERFIINTGLKMSLDKYKCLSSVKMFLIDEVIDCVSEENIDKICDLFDVLKHNYKKVIVISHNEDLKKKVEHKIEIFSDKRVSKIV